MKNQENRKKRKTMLSFESDYNNGAHPKIIEELRRKIESNI